MQPTPIPPPPPFPPGDPRLGPAQVGHPAPPWLAHQAVPLPAQASRRGLGRVPTVAAVLGVGAMVLVGLFATVQLSGHSTPAGHDASGGTPPVVHVGRPTTPPLGAAQPGVTPPAAAAPAAAPTHGIDLGTAPTLSVALPKIEAFVEEARGHLFLRPVVVTPLSDKAFLARLHHADGPADPAVVGEGETFEALHLIPRHTDLAATLAADSDSDVGGFYDPTTKQLYVRGVTLTPLAQTIVAHELTHALDDQYFDLSRVQAKAKNSDEDEAIRSLIEGDARSVEDRFKAAMVPADRTLVAREAQQEFGPTKGSVQPPLFLAIYAEFPYELGEQFVTFLRATGGVSAVDAAFRSPPLSTLQVIDPRYTYLQRINPLAWGRSSKPVGETGTLVDQDSLGALGLAAVLSEKSPQNLLREQAVGYLAGDRYRTTKVGSRICVREDVVALNPGGGNILYTALSAWAHAHPGATVAKVGPLSTVLTSCVS